MNKALPCLLAAPTFFLLTSNSVGMTPVAQEFGDVVSAFSIAEGGGGFGGVLADGDRFGAALALNGDVDGDGISDLAVGAPGANGAGDNRGAVWILFLEADGSVRDSALIDDSSPNLAGSLADGGAFGTSLTFIADLDGDGVPELAVGVPSNDVALALGTLRILFLNNDGSLKSQVTIGQGLGGFNETIVPADRFGQSLTNIGDIDGNGAEDIAVGYTADDGFFSVRMKTSGSVKGVWKIATGLGGIGGPTLDQFGAGLGTLPDTNGDGVSEILVGAVDPTLTDSSLATGVDKYSLLTNGTVGSGGGILGTDALFGSNNPSADFFGVAIAGTQDFDGDGSADMFVGSPGTDVGSNGASATDAGGIWIHLLDPSGFTRKIFPVDLSQPLLAGLYGAGDHFGQALATAAVLNGAGEATLFVGVPDSDGNGIDRGSIVRMRLAANDSPATSVFRNGTGVNFPCLDSSTVPTITSGWGVQLNPSVPFGFFSGVVIYDQPLDPGVLLSSGELLINIVGGNLLGGLTNTTTNPWSGPIAIPNDTNLLGFTFSAQAFEVRVPGELKLCNALDLTIGI